MSKGWRPPFEDPIKVDGRMLVTLLDAGEYISRLPKNEHARRNDKLRWRR